MQSNVISYFEEGAARDWPAKPAVIDGDITMTFAELRTQARQVAVAIIRLGDVVNRPVAVYLPKSAATVVANLAILYSGNIYTNLDVKSPPQRLANILAHIGPRVVITTTERLSEVLAAGIDRQIVLLIDDIDPSSTGETSILEQRRAELIDTDPVCIINTSGSTGTPKGVALSHRGTIDFMDWVFDTFAFDERTVVGSLSPFYFDIYTLELIVCLAKGATLVIIPEQLAIFPAKLIEFLTSEKVNFLFWVPTIMVNIANLGLLDKLALPDLKRVFFAGEVFPTRQLNVWRKAWPAAQFVNLYGPIEIHVDCTYHMIEGDMADDAPLSIGVPCCNTDILILNEANERCRTDELGELCVRGSSLALGYWNDPEKTARAFVQNPLNPHYPELIYRTGDLAIRRADGLIFLAGRKDYQIKHLGYRIELPEIEHQLLAIPGIANACVLYDHPTKAITAFYQPVDDEVTIATIRAALLQIFPKYMVPTVYHSVEKLPTNPNGKIDRNGLMQQMSTAG